MGAPPSWLLAACATLGACNIIAGYPNFETVTGDGGGDANGGGGASTVGGSGGTGAAGGAGGGMMLPPLSCAWTSVEKLDSLESETAGYQRYDDTSFAMTNVSSRAMSRFIVSRPVAAGGKTIALWSMDDSEVYSHERAADAAFDFVRLDGSTTGALIEEPRPNERAIALLAIPDDSDSGETATVHSVVGVSDTATRFDAEATSAGDGSAAILYTYKLPGADNEARFVHWDGIAGPSIPIDDSSGTTLTPGDYTIVLGARDGSGLSHFLVGDQGEGATHRRHFVIPDDVAAEVAPAGDVQLTSATPFLFGFEPRADDAFLVAYADLSVELQLLMGLVPAGELPLQSTDGLASLSFGTEILFDGGAHDFTEESFLVVGHQGMSPLGLVVLLTHRTSGVRFAEQVPFPEPSVFPASFTMRRIATVVVDDQGIDSVLGGTIHVAFFVTDDDTDHDELYAGRLECHPR